MSVPVNQRSHGKLEACVRAHDLCVYTLQITANKNVFTVEYQAALTDRIIATALNIHTLTWSANNTLVKTPEDLRKRQKLQEDAAIQCNILLSLIQIAGISMLDRLDHYIKEQLHAKLYIRYMDDFLIISKDTEYLQDCMRKVGEKLRSLRFETNPKKTRIYPLSKGIMFLGFSFRLTETGKIIMLIDPKNVKRERLKLRRLVKRSRKGLIPREKVNESYASWRAHAGKGNTHNMLIRIDEFYKSLWEEDDNGDSHQKGNNEPQRQSGPGKHGGESRTDAGTPGLQHHDGESRGSRGNGRGGRIMEHSAKFELVKNYYNDGLWKKKAVKNAVKREWITAAEYTEITGDEYDG